MGCDIHLYAEHRENGKWVATDADTIERDEEDGWIAMKNRFNGRDYSLFGLLSEGVRREVPQAFSPKGFPADASPEVTSIYERWDSDAHSANYLTIQELKEKGMELLLTHDSGAAYLVGALQDLLSQLPEPIHGPENHRIVFFFDF